MQKSHIRGMNEKTKGIAAILCAAFFFAPVSYTHLTLPTRSAV